MDAVADSPPLTSHSPGATSPVAAAAIVAERDALLEQRDLALLKLETKQLQSLAGLPVLEAFGDVVDRTEFLYDDPSFGFGRLVQQFTSIDDRKEGRYRPVYETEQDLARIRMQVRNLFSLTPFIVGAGDSLANYVLGSGFQFSAKPEQLPSADSQALAISAAAAPLAAKVNQIIERFIDDVDFCGIIDREINQRSREDGEAFLHLIVDGEQVGCEFAEADQIVEPQMPAALEDFMTAGDKPIVDYFGPCCWKFGVLTPAGRTSKALAYHVVRDGIGNDWDLVQSSRMEHIKRNVTRNAKRGVSDFFPVLGDLQREAKLRRNMSEGAALQSAIAWIMQAAPGQTSAQITAFSSNNRVAQYTRPAGPNGVAKTQNVNHYPPGSVVTAGAGQEYKPGPMGAERNQGFGLVGQYALRAIGTRWNMPEFLISGDASNANYASTLVSQSPFVKARQADQQFYRLHFLSILWKVVRLHFDSGRLDRFGCTWEQLRELVVIDAVAPDVTSADPAEMAKRHDTQLKSGVISVQTAREQAGLDHQQEESRGAKAAPPPPAPIIGGPFGSPIGQSLSGGSSLVPPELPISESTRRAAFAAALLEYP